jgi:hypothetical protein
VGVVGRHAFLSCCDICLLHSERTGWWLQGPILYISTHFFFVCIFLAKWKTTSRQKNDAPTSLYTIVLSVICLALSFVIISARSTATMARLSPNNEGVCLASTYIIERAISNARN